MDGCKLECLKIRCRLFFSCLYFKDPKRAPHFKTYLGVYTNKIAFPIFVFKVEVLSDNIDRDDVKQNIPVLKMAASLLGLRVGVGACTVHVQALYDYMQVPCPRSSGRTCHIHA